jgi:hypothetical protein
MVAHLAIPLRGVERRRAEALRVEEDAHETELKPLAASMIVTADEQDFIAAILKDVRTSAWLGNPLARTPQRKDGVMALGQPIHQVFNIVLLEAACRLPGGPRLDPRKIKGAGLVLRRQSGQGLQGWMSDGPAKKGWLALGAMATDPDPASRDAPRSGHAQLDQLIAGRRSSAGLAEQVFPLFTAPPDLCAALGKTVLYSVIPVASNEFSETPGPAPDFNALPASEKSDLDAHLSSYLKTRQATNLPLAGQALHVDWANGNSAEAAQLQQLLFLLRQLAVECDAFGPSAQAKALMALLARVALPLQVDVFSGVILSIAASDFLAAAAPVLLEGDVNAVRPVMPLQWPAITPELGADLARAVYACISARFAEVASKAGKFDEQSRHYQAQAFLRVACKADCPPKIVWSEPSEDFTILPWWAGAAPLVQIPLPEISDIKSLKPSVAFQVPKELANLLNKDLSKVLSGGAPSGGTPLNIGWLCSFSIPIITICAFVLLSIVIVLLNIVFWWLPFVKICLPVPKRGGG